MNAQEFLKMTSPDDNFGLRADLQKHTLRRMVEKEMEMYAEYKLKEVKAFEMLEMLEKLSLIFKNFNPPTKEVAVGWANQIDNLIKEATTL